MHISWLGEWPPDRNGSDRRVFTLARSMLPGEAMQVANYLRATTRGGAVASNARDLRHYFEYSSSGVDVVEDGLKEMTFGEYLVEQGALDRFQLFRALQMQDRLPGVRLGECAAALGYTAIGRVEKLYAEFVQLSTVTVE